MKLKNNNFKDPIYENIRKYLIQYDIIDDADIRRNIKNKKMLTIGVKPLGCVLSINFDTEISYEDLKTKNPEIIAEQAYLMFYNYLSQHLPDPKTWDYNDKKHILNNLYPVIRTKGSVTDPVQKEFLEYTSKVITSWNMSKTRTFTEFINGYFDITEPLLKTLDTTNNDVLFNKALKNLEEFEFETTALTQNTYLITSPTGITPEASALIMSDKTIYSCMQKLNTNRLFVGLPDTNKFIYSSHENLMLEFYNQYSNPDILFTPNTFTFETEQEKPHV